MNAYDDNIAIWTKRVLSERGITSARQAEVKVKGHLSYATIQNMLNGKRVDVELFIRFAQAFEQDVLEALRFCGYTEMVRVLEDLADHPHDKGESAQAAPNELTYEPLDHDEEEVVSFYRGIAPIMRPAAKAALKAILDSMPDAEDWTTYGKKAK